MNKKSVLAVLCFTLVLAFLPMFLPKLIANAESSDIDKRAEEIYGNMDETERICQTLMIHSHQWNGKDTTTVEPDLAEILQKYHFGGFVLFGQNTPTTESTFQFIQDLQKNTMTTHAGQSQAGLPMITTPDQEGGAVFRLYTGSCLLGNMATGATFDSQVAKNSGRIISEELNSLGIDSTLAPCVDVNSNAGNPIIGLRSFGDDKNWVGNLGSNFMQNCKANGTLAFVKHFPGHGDVASDTHLGKVTSDKTYEQLMANDVVPFKQCIDDGCEAIMTAHITFPNIDNTLLKTEKKYPPEKPETEIITPATFSKRIMKDILRDELQYDGLACTDAITMQGISNYFTEPTAVKLALEAGNDMVAEAVNATNKDDFIKQTDAIISGVKEWAKELDHSARLKEAVLRVIKAKIKSGIIDYNPDNYTLENARQVLRNPETLATEYTDTAKSITLIKNNEDTLPLKVDKNSKVLYLTQNSTSTTNANRTSASSFAIAWNRLKANKLVPQNLMPTIFTFNKNTNMDELKPMIDNADYVITDSGVNANGLMGYLSWQTKTPNDIVDYAHEKNKKSVVLSVRLPYDCQLYPNADAILCTYNYVGATPDYQTVLKNGDTTTDDVCGPNLIEGIEAIFGNINPRGKLPVNVPKFNFDSEHPGYTDEIIYNNGYGLTYEAQGGQVINIDNVLINLECSAIEADGSEKCPAVNITTSDQATITYGSTSNASSKYFTVPVAREAKTFQEGIDYTVTYTNNIEPGTASATINGTGSLIGTKTINFEITQGPSITAQTSDSATIYTLILIICLAISSFVIITYLNPLSK